MPRHHRVRVDLHGEAVATGLNVMVGGHVGIGSNVMS
jgi:hypothetical protein